LGQNLLDSIIGIAKKQICDLGRSCGSDEREISVAFRLWQQEETDRQPFDNPDRHERTLHRRSERFGLLARVGFRFMTLGCRKADIEWLLSGRRQFQSTDGTNCRKDTIHARTLLHGSQ
jgi:hypothetical protein